MENSNKITYEERYGSIAAEQLRELRSEFMKKNNPIFKERCRKKSSKSHMGRKLSKETCKKLSESKKGKCPKNVKLLQESGKKTRFKKGIIPWNKGLSGHLSEESKKKISLAGMGRKQSEETKIKRGLYIGRKITDIEKKNLSKLMKERRKTMVMPVHDTKIEVKTQKLLKRLGIEFMTHQYMKEIKYRYQCDIFIPVQEGIQQKTVIECDGDYWHGNLDKYPIKNMNKKIRAQRCLDYERTSQLEEAGFRVIRLWEHKIKKMDSDELKQELIVTIK